MNVTITIEDGPNKSVNVKVNYDPPRRYKIVQGRKFASVLTLAGKLGRGIEKALPRLIAEAKKAD